MSCCKAGEYGGWCGSEDVVFTDTADDNKEYCVFHAPIGKKGVRKEEFQELVHEHIDEVIANNEKNGENKFCDFSGTIFKREISFIKYNNDNPLPPISFKFATFNSKAGFQRV
ncbi:MAG: hypothetical protein HQK93_09275 [Nitrospirae bacterium]|nr:hypothetical protein [Nitrospirota bacterium]